jgi:hypothetical protein
MVMETGGIFKVTVALRAFDRGGVRGKGDVGQTKRTTMRAGGTMVIDVGISNITIITVVLIFGHGRHGEDSIVMLVVV